MQTIATTALLVAYASAIKISTENPAELRFNDWAAQLGWSYSDVSERNQRFQNWLDNDAEFQRINADQSNTFKVGHNQFSDLSRQEYLAILGDGDQPDRPELAQVNTEAGATVFADASQVADFNWLNYSPPIADQGYCGTCWAFATSAGLEIQNAITNSSAGVLKFSEQLIVDCNPWQYGCNGGATSAIVQSWMAPKAVRVALASAYPYKASRGRCNTKITRQVYYPTQQVNYLYSSTQGASAAYIAGLQTGPVVVRVRADTSIWQGYSSGVLNNPDCYGDSGIWNHAVVIVGTGVQDGLSYWLIRNSWGTSWGESGYIKIAITESGYGICGQMVQGWNIRMRAI